MNAKEAKENTINYIKDTPKYKEIIEQIRDATYDHRFEIKYKDSLCSCIKHVLHIVDGYRVDTVNDVTTISWI